MPAQIRAVGRHKVQEVHSQGPRMEVSRRMLLVPHQKILEQQRATVPVLTRADMGIWLLADIVILIPATR